MGQIPELMTVGEVAEAFRMSDETVHRWCRQGRLEYVDLHGIKRFHRAYIEDLIANSRRLATSTAPAGSAA